MAGVLTRHLEQLDVLFEQLIDQLRQIHALGPRKLGQRSLYVLAQVDRLSKLGTLAEELAALALAEVVLILHGFTLGTVGALWRLQVVQK
jgi:hypothetical protein